MTAPTFQPGDEIEWLDDDPANGTPVWRPGTVIGVRYGIHTPGGGLSSVAPQRIRSAPRLPLEGIEQ